MGSVCGGRGFRKFWWTKWLFVLEQYPGWKAQTSCHTGLEINPDVIPVIIYDRWITKFTGHSGIYAAVIVTS